MAYFKTQSTGQLQPEYAQLIQAVIQCVLTALPKQLHSIYLYGSIAKAITQYLPIWQYCQSRAMPFVSNADFSIVLHQELSIAEQATLQ